MSFRRFLPWASLCLAACLTLGASAQTALRPEVAGPLLAARDALKAGKADEAQAQLRLVENLPQRSAQENYHLARIKAPVAMALNDHAAALAALEQALNSPELPASDRLALMENAAAVAWRAKRADAAELWARRYLSEGGNAESVRTVLVQALNARGATADMVQELGLLIQHDVAAGRVPSEPRLRLLAAGHRKLGDAAAYRADIEQLLRYHPSPAYWRDLIGQVEQQPGFAKRLLLESARLLRHVGAMTEADDYLDLADMAQQAGQPIEALAVLNDGWDRKLLGQGADAAKHQALRDKLTRLAAEDRQRLPAGQKDAAKAKDGGPLVALGQAFASAGDLPSALALMDQGLKLGGGRQPDEARLRYGATLLRAGQTEAAHAMFKTVQGGDGSADLARLWLLAAPAAAAGASGTTR